MDEPRLDPRMNDADRRLSAALDESAPKRRSEGLVERVVAASMPSLISGRSRAPHRLRMPVVLARVAVAAVLGMGLVLAFWSSPVREFDSSRTLPIALAPGDRPSGALVAAGPFQWRDGAMLTLLQVQDMAWDDALGDLETVVHTVRTGQSGRLGLVGDTTPLDRVESELLTVTHVTGGAS